MVFKWYDKDMTYLRAISEYKGLRITEELETGYKTAQFSLPYDVFVSEEQKVEIDGYLYVIKEVNMEALNLYDVYCHPYFGKLKTKHIESLTGVNMAFRDIMNTILEETDWTCEIADQIIGSFQLDLHRQIALDAINAVAKLFQAELYFDTKAKIVYAYNKRGDSDKSILLDGSNLRQQRCLVQSNTYDLITRLIPIGKKDTTISLANNGQLWVENFEYTTEVVTGYYIDSKCENADDLLKIAKAKVAETGRPHTTYKLYPFNLAIDLEIGDTVRIIDNIRHVDTIKRVEKKVTYPSQVESSFVELGSPQVSFDNIYKDLKDAQKIVNEDSLRSINDLLKTYEQEGQHAST